MKSIEGILKLVENEFEAIVNNGKFRSREEIDSVYKLMDIVKDAYCIWAYEEEEESGYSEYGYGYDDGGGSMRYGGESRSYARGRGRNARRDSMGRYSREGGGMSGEMSGRNGRSRRSYRSEYSRADARQEYMDELRELMESAPDDQSRQSIQRMIQQMEQQG